MKIVAVIPAYYEESRIGITVRKTKPFVDLVVVVDDGSADKTSEEAEKNGAVVIKHEKNKGAGAAIRTGINYGLKNKYDVCVVLGGDDQDDPHQIPSLLEKIKEGYDFVQGSRNLDGGKTVNIPLFRKITTTSYSFLFKILTGFPITDGSNGFRAFKLDLLNDKRINLRQKWLERYELEPYLFYKSIIYKYKVIESPVTKRYPYDHKEYSKMVPFVDWWRMIKPLLYLKLRIKK